MKQKEWLAAYLYYSENWEKFLTNAVIPFVQEMLDKKLAVQYFFIRYWERGPHIRLRFKGDTNLLEKKIKPKLIRHFKKYYKHNPSKRQEPVYPANFPDDQRWFPNNSIQFIEYEPEVERYGGSTGILIAEQQFQACSNAVLAIMAESEEWNYERALGAAIQLHLGFSHALGMDLHEMRHFYTHLFDSWLLRAYYNYEKNISKKELENKKKKTLEAFKNTFKKQKTTLVSFHKTLYDALANKVSFEQDWLNTWIKDMTAIREKLDTAQSKSQLMIPKLFKIDPNEGISEARQQLWYIYNSYVHMANNRLGILNRDEAFLGYLIVNSLRNIKQYA